MTSGPFAPPPGAYPPAPQSPPRSGPSAAKIVGIGCASMLLVGVCAGAVGFTFLGKALSGGSEVAAQPISAGAPFAFEAPSHGRELRVWLEVDAEYSDGFPIRGAVNVTLNGGAVRAATIDGALGERCANPTVGESSSFCLNWRSARRDGHGSAAGRTRLFTVPAQAEGATLSISGALSVGPGTTLRAARLVVTE